MAGALDKLPAGSNGSPVLHTQVPQAPQGGGIIGYPGLEPPAGSMPLGARPAAPQAYVPSPAERPAHLCVRCKHFMERHVMLVDQDDEPVISPVTGQPMKERQGTCLRSSGAAAVKNDNPADLTNETIMTCTHFADRRGIVGRIAELVRKVIA